MPIPITGVRVSLATRGGGIDCAAAGLLSLCAQVALRTMNTKLPNFGGTSASGNDSKYFQTTKKGAPPPPPGAHVSRRRQAIRPSQLPPAAGPCL